MNLQEGNKKTELVRESIITLFEHSKDFKSIEKQWLDEKSKLTSTITEFMRTNGVERINCKFRTETVNEHDRVIRGYKEVCCKKVTSKSVKFDADRLEKRIDNKEISKQIIKKDYVITDWNEIVKVMKKYNVDPNEVIPYIQVNKKVDIDKAEQMMKLGELDILSYKDCYSVSEKSSYLKVGEIKA